MPGGVAGTRWVRAGRGGGWPTEPPRDPFSFSSLLPPIFLTFSLPKTWGTSRCDVAGRGDRALIPQPSSKADRGSEGRLWDTPAGLRP